MSATNIPEAEARACLEHDFAQLIALIFVDEDDAERERILRNAMRQPDFALDIFGALLGDPQCLRNLGELRRSLTLH